MLVGVGETPPQCLPRHPHLGDTMSEQDRHDLPPRALAEEMTAHAILTTDLQGRIRTWNAGAEHAKGYRAEEIIGRHFSVFYPPEVVARGWPEYELQQARREGRFEDEGWRLRKDGSRFWASVVITALHDEAGRHIGFAKLTRDLTEKRRISALEDEGKRLTTFLANYRAEVESKLREKNEAVPAVPEMMIIADRNTRYWLLVSVMFSAKQKEAGYKHFRLIVQKNFAVHPPK